MRRNFHLIFERRLRNFSLLVLACKTSIRLSRLIRAGPAQAPAAEHAVDRLPEKIREE